MNIILGGNHGYKGCHNRNNIRKKDEVEKLNSILHDYSKWIIGRMGMPYPKKSINIINIIVDAPQDEINTLSGKIGKLSGITSKVIYSNV